VQIINLRRKCGNARILLSQNNKMLKVWDNNNHGSTIRKIIFLLLILL